MKVLFVSNYPELGPSSRYRIVQFLEPLRALGVDSDFLPLFSNDFFKSFYKPGRLLYKSGYLAMACARRLRDALDARRYDVVFVQREAAIIGPPVFELLAKYVARRPIVFDLDDAIFHKASETQQASKYPILRRVLKSSKKAEQIARMADEVVCAGEYTASWARRLNSHVTVIPTVVSGKIFKPRSGPANPKPVIGWIGSTSAAPQLEIVLPALERLRKKHDFRVKIVGAGRDFIIPGVEVDNLTWSLEREIADFQSLDIGLCPLFDDAWSKGKPGFKPLIYMACGIAQVSTPIGGVMEFMTDGVEGLFARTGDEWFRALDRLLSDPALRYRMAERARASFESGPSLESAVPKLYAVLERAAGSSRYRVSGTTNAGAVDPTEARPPT